MVLDPVLCAADAGVCWMPSLSEACRLPVSDWHNNGSTSPVKCRGYVSSCQLHSQALYQLTWSVDRVVSMSMCDSVLLVTRQAYTVDFVSRCVVYVCVFHTGICC